MKNVLFSKASRATLQYHIFASREPISSNEGSLDLHWVGLLICRECKAQEWAGARFGNCSIYFLDSLCIYSRVRNAKYEYVSHHWYSFLNYHKKAQILEFILSFEKTQCQISIVCCEWSAKNTTNVISTFVGVCNSLFKINSLPISIVNPE